jgi:hypothetical protein
MHNFFDLMSGRENPVGYFSVYCALDKQNHLKNVRVVLSHTTHPGNIGAAARAMKTMGLRHLYSLMFKPIRWRRALSMCCAMR